MKEILEKINENNKYLIIGDFNDIKNNLKKLWS